MNARSSLPLTRSTHEFTSFDNLELFYRAWHPGHTGSRAIVLFHGGHEHSGRFEELVQALALPDTSLYAWDARGHGKTKGRRGYADHFMDYVRDADHFIRHICETSGIDLRDIVLVGHSVGSVIASTWLHDYGVQVRGAVLGSPAFDVKLYAPLAVPALKLWQRAKPDSFVSSYVKPAMLTHDPIEAEARRHDKLISPKIAVRVLTSLFDTANRVINNASGIQVPVLVLSAQKDYIVHRAAQRKFVANLGSDEKRLISYEGFYHEIFHELDRQRPIQDAKTFITNCFDKTPRTGDKLIKGVNRSKYNDLKKSVTTGVLAQLVRQVSSASLRGAGLLSKGIRTGCRHGFDSGSMLNYVYANKATGAGPIGRFFDRTYLDATGWAGIRQRGDNLQKALNSSIDMVRRKKKDVHIMDVAAGPGRYLIDTLVARKDPDITVLCRDWAEQGLSEGRELAANKGLTTIDYEKSDAFDQASLQDTDKKPDVIVASGLYELFADNQKILQSLHGIHGAMEEGGILIFTNQPTHPQLESIARTLTNRDGDPWIMRLRPQSEMNGLVESAGFALQSMAIDNDGIFTVSIARKL